jgi:putative endonuclease
VRQDRRGQIGRRGEDLAAARLERMGYEVVERNFRTREGELDLIAIRRRTLVFCEVKALVTHAGGRAAGPVHPLEAIRPAKRAQVRRIARAWLAERRASGSSPRYDDLRFDAIGLLLSPRGELLQLDHVEGAF